MDITNKEETDQKTSCLTVYDGLKPKDSLISIANRLAKKYIVEKMPVCNVPNMCITDKHIDSQGMSKRNALNRGMSCVFASVPRNFIKVIQMYVYYKIITLI
ncbi:uncharacterized protein LOC126897891 [Daktulosphaira vitifoliae]|uniref:uncharacterized protein LOC126897891 n=1 Tax=Daktulosphaira vitifoliae TaxID=58002 RepID=UPI0021A9BA3F|nr:uncharacterized protein LOC126897891 [Daktulosphaira vitifoliae]